MATYFDLKFDELDLLFIYMISFLAGILLVIGLFQAISKTRKLNSNVENLNASNLNVTPINIYILIEVIPIGVIYFLYLFIYVLGTAITNEYRNF